MEMGSGSSCSSNSGSDSLNGLKFGQKTYFEDVSIGAPPKFRGGSSPSAGAGKPLTTKTIPPSPPPPLKKRMSRGAQVGQPRRCQVEGCRVDLSDVKAYYSRYKVWNMHSKSPTVIMNGLEQRFCQQCSRTKVIAEISVCGLSPRVRSGPRHGG